MPYTGYNHSYYLWHIYKEDSVIGAVGTLYLTSQTTTGQIRALEERLQGKLFKCKGRGPKSGELGELVYRYADKTFILNQEMLDIVSYHKESNLLFDAGAIGALSKRLVSSVLGAAVVENKQIYLHCFESTHEMLLEQLSQHKLDTIISNCPIDSTQQEGLLSMKISEYGVSLRYTNPLPEKPSLVHPGERRLPIPGRRPTLGRKLLSRFNSQGLNVEILGELGNAVLVRAFGAMHNAILVAPSLYANDSYNNGSVMEIGRAKSAMEEYYAIFVKRMIQHPAIQRICNIDYPTLSTPASK